MPYEELKKQAMGNLEAAVNAKTSKSAFAKMGVGVGLLLLVVFLSFSRNVEAASGQSYLYTADQKMIQVQAPIPTEDFYVFNFAADVVNVTMSYNDDGLISTYANENVSGEFRVPFADMNLTVAVSTWNSTNETWSAFEIYVVEPPTSGPQSAVGEGYEFPYEYEITSLEVLDYDEEIFIEVGVFTFYLPGSELYNVTVKYYADGIVQDEYQTILNYVDVNAETIYTHSVVFNLAEMEDLGLNATIEISMWSNEYDEYGEPEVYEIEVSTFTQEDAGYEFFPWEADVPYIGPFWIVYVVAAGLGFVALLWYVGEKVGDSRVRARNTV